jgi:hypothetical protein
MALELVGRTHRRHPECDRGRLLVFAAADQSLPAIVVAATGAQAVQGLGGTHWVARSPGFWVTLGSAMGLVQPANATLRGIT